MTGEESAKEASRQCRPEREQGETGYQYIALLDGRGICIDVMGGIIRQPEICKASE